MFRLSGTCSWLLSIQKATARRTFRCNSIALAISRLKDKSKTIHILVSLNLEDLPGNTWTAQFQLFKIAVHATAPTILDLPPELRKALIQHTLGFLRKDISFSCCPGHVGSADWSRTLQIYKLQDSVSELETQRLKQGKANGRLRSVCSKLRDDAIKLFSPSVAFNLCVRGPHSYYQSSKDIQALGKQAIGITWRYPPDVLADQRRERFCDDKDHAKRALRPYHYRSSGYFASQNEETTRFV
jgi:hypothetical protein